VNSALRNVVPHLVFKRAEGATLVDVDGNEYIDYHGAFGPVLLGHNHFAVRRCVKRGGSGCRGRARIKAQCSGCGER
jgi:glutamate-1-semialdehyde 2,1-aminomutase